MIIQRMKCDICGIKTDSDEHSGGTIVGWYRAWDGRTYSICRGCEENLFMDLEPPGPIPSQEYQGGSLTSFM